MPLLIKADDHYKPDQDEINKLLGRRMYHRYLKSYGWKQKRAKVLKRDKNKCQICGRRANYVHHTSYNRIFSESLFDLVSLCRICHDFIHADTRHVGKGTRNKLLGEFKHWLEMAREKLSGR